MKKSPPIVKTFSNLQKVFDNSLLLEDRGIIRTIVASIIANQICDDPVWILFVAASGGGKSEILASIEDITHMDDKQMIFDISDLTVNTFASAQKKIGEETSLLMKMQPGSIMKFKDFTSLLSKNREARDEIMGQLREIYDGKYVKRTGNNNDIEWSGRLGAFGGVTEVIYEYLAVLSAMGDRFIMYSIKQPNRRAVAMAKLKNSSKMTSIRDDMKVAMKSYTEFVLESMDEYVPFEATDAMAEILIDIADFSTKVRSGVITDFRTGRVEFVPSTEMPTRMIDQLFGICKGFAVMKENDLRVAGKKMSKADYELTKEDISIIKNIAFDSIPLKRRMALRILAKYTGGATTAGVATALGYQTEVVKAWLATLNSLGICYRVKRPGNGDVWKLQETYRPIFADHEGIVPIAEICEGEDDKSDYQFEDYDEESKHIMNEEEMEAEELWNSYDK